MTDNSLEFLHRLDSLLREVAETATHFHFENLFATETPDEDEAFAAKVDGIYIAGMHELSSAIYRVLWDDANEHGAIYDLSPHGEECYADRDSEYDPLNCEGPERFQLFENGPGSYNGARFSRGNIDTMIRQLDHGYNAYLDDDEYDENDEDSYPHNEDSWLDASYEARHEYDDLSFEDHAERLGHTWNDDLPD